jgi:membrane protein implicated in regulation of membrane protease activity
MLDLGIDLNVWPWVWLFVAVVFALIELTILGGSFILLPFAISAFIASLLGFYDVAIEIQWAVFVFGGGALFFGFYRWASRFLRDNLLAPGVGADRLVGMTGIVTVAITPDDTDRRGRVSIDGELWGALAPDDETIPQGVRVRITAMQGTRVLVARLDAGEQPAGGDQQ